MTEILINANDRRIQYTATAGQTVFPYDFPIYESGDLAVVRNRAGVITTLALTTDYTLSGVGAEAGGNVTLVTGATLDDGITIYGSMPYDRTSDFSTGGDFKAETINKDLDRLAIMAQQLNRDLTRVIKLEVADTATSIALVIETSAERQNRALTFNSDGTGLEAGPTASDITSAQGYAEDAETAKTAAEAAQSAAEAAETAAVAAAAGLSLPSITAGSGRKYLIVKADETGYEFTGKDNFTATTNPGVGDDSADGYALGSKWYNTSASPREAYLCVDASAGAAVWVQVTLDTEDLGSMAFETATNYQPLAPRVQSVTSAATVTPTSANDLVKVTAQAEALTIANPTGTMAEGQALVIRLKDNGTARAISFGANYRALGVTLPTTTVLSKTMYIFCIWNDTDTKFDVTGVALQA